MDIKSFTECLRLGYGDAELQLLDLYFSKIADAAENLITFGTMKDVNTAEKNLFDSGDFVSLLPGSRGERIRNSLSDSEVALQFWFEVFLLGVRRTDHISRVSGQNARDVRHGMIATGSVEFEGRRLAEMAREFRSEDYMEIARVLERAIKQLESEFPKLKSPTFRQVLELSLQGLTYSQMLAVFECRRSELLTQKRVERRLRDMQQKLAEIRISESE